MFAWLIEWWNTPRHIKMMRKELHRSRCDLVNARASAEYVTAHAARLETSIKRLEKELKK